MKKLFISQPMNGVNDKDIKAFRAFALRQAEKELGEEVELIDSFFESAPHDVKPLWFLGKSLELLSQADVVIFAPGWDHARGCIMEHEAVKKYMPDTPILECLA